MHLKHQMREDILVAEIKRRLFVDIETYSEVDLKTCGVYRYVDDPAFEVMLFAYAYDDEPVTVVDIANGESLPSQVLADLANPYVVKIAQFVFVGAQGLAKYITSRLPIAIFFSSSFNPRTLPTSARLRGSPSVDALTAVHSHCSGGT